MAAAATGTQNKTNKQLINAFFVRSMPKIFLFTGYRCARKKCTEGKIDRKQQKNADLHRNCFLYRIRCRFTEWNYFRYFSSTFCYVKSDVPHSYCHSHLSIHIPYRHSHYRQIVILSFAFTIKSNPNE